MSSILRINSITSRSGINTLDFTGNGFSYVTDVGFGTTNPRGKLDVQGTFLANGGNAGIGTTLPTSRLDVVGDVQVSGVVTATSFSGTATIANTLATNATGTNLTLSGNLTVNGTQTTINSQILDISDKTVGVASTSTKTALTQDGGGLVIYGPSDINFTYDRNKVAVGLNTNLSVTGVITATEFDIAGTTNTFTAGGLSVGIVTATTLLVGSAVTINSSGVNATGVITATSYRGDGSNLTGVSAGLTLRQAGTTVTGGAATTVNFASGATITSVSSGIATITIAAGIQTEAATPSSAVTTLDLSKQDHKVTATGIVTVTCSGGTEGDSHTVRIVNSGIATVGFSTFFLFPSGSPPVLPTTSGAISIVSFTVHRVGAGGTQLLAGASLNFS